MTRFADPRRCPDCGTAIPPGAAACPSCRLPLRGDVAQRLYATLLTADRLLAELRDSTPAQPVPAGASAAGALPGASLPTAAPGEPAAAPAAEPTRAPAARLRATSVPKILLALGAGCVLVAALVFLAVTWSVMGVGGRTATLVLLTIGCGALTGWLARRDLRAGAESLSLVTLGLLTLDLFGARDAGWLGDLADSTFALVLGAVLVTAGGAAAVTARRTRIGALTGAEVVVAIGAAAAALGAATLERVETSPGAVAAVLVAAAVSLGAWRLGLVWALRASVLVTAAAWLTLLSVALERGFRHQHLGELWLDLHGWPLVAAVALAAAPALVREVPAAARLTAANAAYAVAVVALALPVLDEGVSPVAGVVVLALGATAMLTWRAPATWWATGLAVQAVAGLAAAALSLILLEQAGERVLEAVVPPWAGSTGGSLPRWAPGVEVPEPWLLPLLAVALLATAAAVAARLLGTPSSGSSALAPSATVRSAAATVAASVVAVAGLAMLALYPVPVWAVVAAGLAVAGGLLAAWLRTASPAPLVASAGFVVVALAASGYDDVLSALTLTATVGLAGLVHLRSENPETSAAAGAALAATAVAGIWVWGRVADTEVAWASLVALVIGGVALLPLHLLPGRLWAHPDASLARAGLEVGVAVAAVPLAVAGVTSAPAATELTWTAVYLTVAGVVVSAVALLRPDRSWLLPVGGLLLVAASWVRLWEIGVRAPEAYTMPSAAVLAVVGLLHLHRRAESGTQLALGPALGLGLVPSLLWALAEGPGLRALLLGAGCLALVLGGGAVRWAAPLLWGAAVGALLVVRLSSPYVEDAVPTWVLIGGAGALLIAVGVTWEQRLQEARRVVGYVRGLR